MGHMMEHHLQQVGMGQLKVGARDEQLQAVLGSCVGIAFIWKKGGRCGLAHCLLPESPDADNSLGARYVSQAVPSLLRLMGARQSDYPDIEVVLAGGASMFSGRSGRLQVGQQNVAAARKYLSQCGLHVEYCELGGRCGRQILIDCADQSYSITKIVAQSPEPAYGNERSAAY
ncbi:chemotaxis protein CheD [Janthinobacterium agaricidamnosum]|uniref:CheD family protein n=1 Tax=Janthinobacterium agaricidamnosum NBRC 102515 = DSM 9628 TaxID=1349767 RepID=W0V2K6_9BURK|nr:chemotaxis protein CheD [Janthinobacterium agaricidamnosum]CDG83054.1 cheD family protein [Janthinobacterium agaricidamnosum NBRC 102515 = DSM 9628]